MSLYQTSLINIFNQLNNGNIVLGDLQGNIPNDLLNIINEYIDISNENAFTRSVSEQYFQLADFFLNKIDNKNIVLILTAEVQGENRNIPGINYLIDKNLIDPVQILNAALKGASKNKYPFGNISQMEMINYLIQNGATDMNTGLMEAVAANNFELIAFFIDKGANDFNKAFTEAIKYNNINLADFFVKNGANLLAPGLHIAAKNGNKVLIEHILTLKPNILTTTSLGLAMNYGHIDLIDILVTSGRPLLQEINPVYVGPRILDLLNQTKLQTKSGIDYSNLFRYAKRGYILLRFLRFLPLLYSTQNLLYVINTTKIIMDQTLNNIFGNMPSLYENHDTGTHLVPVLNTHNTSSITVLKEYDPEFKISPIGEIENKDLYELLMLNVYYNIDVPIKIINFINDPGVQIQLLAESKLLEALLRSYSPTNN
jgi:ankyrin repeat protein